MEWMKVSVLLMLSLCLMASAQNAGDTKTAIKEEIKKIGTSLKTLGGGVIYPMLIAALVWLGSKRPEYALGAAGATWFVYGAECTYEMTIPLAIVGVGAARKQWVLVVVGGAMQALTAAGFNFY